MRETFPIPAPIRQQQACRMPLPISQPEPQQPSVDELTRWELASVTIMAGAAAVLTPAVITMQIIHAL